MVAFNLLIRIAYEEIPPRVEYKLTVFGQRFISILDAVVELQHEIAAECQPHNKALEPNDEKRVNWTLS